MEQPTPPKGRAWQDLADFEAVFKALAHATRRNILVSLQSCGGYMTAGQIQRAYDHKWPTITRHLRQLEAAGLVKVEKRGREQRYTLHSARLLTVMGKWMGPFHTDTPIKE